MPTAVWSYALVTVDPSGKQNASSLKPKSYCPQPYCFSIVARGSEDKSTAGLFAVNSFPDLPTAERALAAWTKANPRGYAAVIKVTE